MNTSRSFKHINKDLYEYSQELKRREKVPSFGGMRVENSASPVGRIEEGDVQPKNSFATYNFINRPGKAEKSPGFGSIITSTTPENKRAIGRLETAKFNKEQQQ